MEQILRLLLARADIRLNLLERTEMSSQRSLARAIFAKLKSDNTLRDGQERFRRFMRNINVRGGGQLFDSMTKSDVEAVVESCVPPA